MMTARRVEEVVVVRTDIKEPKATDFADVAEMLGPGRQPNDEYSREMILSESK